MTAKENSDLQLQINQLKEVVLTLTGVVDRLAEKVGCLLQGDVANCARHAERIIVLEREVIQFKVDRESDRAAVHLSLEDKPSNGAVTQLKWAIGILVVVNIGGIAALVALHGPIK